MSPAKQGDTVKVHYTGTLDDGTLFDSSEEREPLEFEIGSGRIIAGFEAAVIGMNVGESKPTRIASEEAYGVHHPEMVLQVPRSQFPAGIEPELNQQLQLQQPDGTAFAVTITKIENNIITLDANHPLAGQALNFEIRLVDIA